MESGQILRASLYRKRFGATWLRLASPALKGYNERTAAGEAFTQGA